MNCCICGPVKNCGPYLDKVFENIEKIGSRYYIILYYGIAYKHCRLPNSF